MSKLKKVLLRAPLLTNSGYGVHSRQIFKWLVKREDIELIVECVQWGMTSWILDQDRENGLIRKIMSKSIPYKKEEIDMSIQVQLPNEWDPKIGKFSVGITAAVETDKCNPKWVECCNKMDHVIVPSTFTKNVIKRSGLLKTKISVVPEWYNANFDNRSLIDKALSDERFKKIEKDFNVLVVAQLTGQTPETDRKNLVNTLKWTIESLQNEKNTGLIIKTNFGKGTEIDKDLSRAYLEKVAKSFRNNSNFPIYFIHGNMSDKEIAALYNHKNVKAYALATRGEGYGLPFIEAAISGLPIIATNWSGHLEFLKNDLFHAVDYNLISVDKKKIDGNIFIEGVRWADPIESSFKEKLLNVYKDYSSAKNKSKELKNYIRKNFNSQIITKKYEDLFKEWDK